MKKTLYILLVLFITAPLSAQPGENEELEKITLQLRWEYEFQFAGFIAAKELGFYREAGLDVDVKDLTYGMNVFEELRSGRAQYALGTTNSIVERNNGTPIVVLAVIFQHSPFVIISRLDANIRTPGDLAGRRISIYERQNTILYAMLRREGVDSDQIEFVPYETDYNSLLNGDVDATTAMITLQPQVFEEMNISYSIMHPQTYGIDFYGNSIITLEKEIEDHPERVNAFREASIRGWTYAMQNKDEIIDIILEKYNTGISRELLRYEADVMDDIMYQDLIEIGHMNPGRWQYIADVYKELGMIDSNFSLEGFLYDPNPTADLSGLMRLLKILGISLAVICLVTMVLCYHYRRLQKAERDKKHTIEKLQHAISEIKTLREMLPICSSCKKIRNDDGFWEHVEAYFTKHTSTEFSHGICPDCMHKLYPDIYDEMKKKKDDKNTDES
ncbi:MAG: ABC transporter substrate-binding protein [bacterium]|nr:ABC transporter substrate-binding protein [bacterium]